MYFNSNFKNNSMINILRIHKLNTTEFIFFFETKCNNSTFADRLFKSVFKSWRFVKYATKRYFKMTTINYISFCFC